MTLSLSLKNLFTKKKSNVGKHALRSFNSKYQNAKHVLWQQVDVSHWQVNFILKSNQYSALFNSQGKWLETVTLLTLDNTPAPIKHKFEENYSKKGIQHIYNIQTPKKNLYEIKWDNGIYVIKLLYDITGKIVSRGIL